MAEIACVSEVELRRMIVQRLAAAHATAPLSCGVVRDAALTWGVSERTMWRWIARGHPAVRVPRGALASERAVELLLQWRGGGMSPPCTASCSPRARRCRAGRRWGERLSAH